MKKILLLILLANLYQLNAQVCFVPHTDYGAGSSPWGIISIDVNEDTKLDLISTNTGNDEVYVSLGNGLGAFGTATSFTVGNNARYLCAADFNSDTHIDIVVSSYGGGTGIIFGDGAGNFGPLTTIASLTSGGICTADFNGDGFKDLAVCDYGGNGAQIVLGDGTGAFSAPVSYGAGAGPQAITSSDFNNDGFADLAVCNWTSNNVSVLLGIGDGTFGPKTNHTVGTAPVSVAAADFDGNGFMDIVTGNSNSWNVTLLMNAGGGVYTATSYSTNYNNPDWLTTGDFNADGNPDVAVTVDNINSVSVFLGNGAGSLTPFINFPVDFSPRGICTGDFNTDGKVDLATANNGGFDVSVLLNAPYPTVVANTTSDTVCAGTSITLTGSGATTYTWTGGVTDGTSFTPSASQTYTVTGVNVNGCTDSDTMRIQVNSLPNVVANTTANLVCAGSTVTLTGSGANTYTWTGGVTDGISFSPTSTQTYTVTGTDLNGCSNSSAGITVAYQTLPVVVALATNSSICIGGSTTLSGGGAISYTWTNGVVDGISFNPSSTQNYTVTGSINGCLGSDTISVYVYQLPVVTATPSTNTVCAGTLVTLSGGGAATYSWTGGINNAIPFVASTSQTYTVTGASIHNCTATATATVNVVSPVVPQLCLITVDSLSLNNVIVWEKASYLNADTFYVYRDTANNSYGLIGKVPFDSLSLFTDTVRSKYAANGDPRASSWRYKIAIKDTCGNISAKSPYHQSIFIQNNSGNFSWSDYKIEGQPVPVPALSNYLFKRDNFANGNYAVIQTLSASSTSYTDGQYSTYQTTADWRIETLWSISCTPTMRYGNNGVDAAIVRSKSNITNNRGIGVKQINASPIQFVIYPNPANTTINIECKIKNAELSILDILGNVVKQLNTIEEKASIDLSVFENGIYFITIKDTERKISSTQKIIVQH